MTLAGTKVGHFRVGKPIGHGGMGEVYLGFNEVLKKEVALKALRAERRLNAASRARFLREARILSSLEHPNICRIHDYVEGDEADFLVLELIDGRSLDMIREDLDHATKLRIAEQIARVLIAAHAADVVHRDLKPSNVMLTSGGEVKVLDFGLARPAHAAPIGESGHREGPRPREGPSGTEHSSRHSVATVHMLEESATFLETALGSVMGTPSYMSPEQARGEPATSASDMYSFGLLLQRLFTGQSPYDETTGGLSLLERAMRAQTRPATGLDSDLTNLINRMKSLATASRPTAVEAAARLRRIREKPKRRIRRLVIGVAVLLVALAGAKYVLDVRRERAVALEARDEAQQRRAQAEDLISYVLGDLRGKLEPLGRLDILDDVGDKALEYFESVDQALLTDEELSKHSKALNQIGEVRIAQGNLEAALESFRQSLSMARGLAERDPLNAPWQKGLGEAHFWVGYVQWQRGDIDGALEEFRAYQNISEGLAAREPESDEWQLELAYGHTNIGSMLEAKGDLAGAIAEYRLALEIKNALVARDPDEAEWQHSLTVTHEDIGHVLQRLGRLDEAEEHYRRSVSINQALVEREPDNADRLRALCVSIHLLGDLLETRGDEAGALEQFRADLTLAQRLADQDPTNSAWRREIAVSHSRIGYLLARSDPADSHRHLGAARRILGEIAHKDPTNALWQRDLAATETTIGLTFEAQEDWDLARRSADSALDTLRSYRDKHPGDREAGRWLSVVHLLEGRLLERQGNRNGAHTAWSHALETIEPLARDSEETAYLEVWARALLRLDRTTEAEPIVRKLHAVGYRNQQFLELCQDKGVTI